MGEDLAHFDDSDSEDGDSGKPSLVLVNPDRRQSTYPKQEVYDCFSGIQLLNTALIGTLPKKTGKCGNFSQVGDPPPLELTRD